MSRNTYCRKRIKPFLDTLDEFGFQVRDIVQRKHLVMDTELRGQRKLFTVAVSGSDHRALKNFRSNVRHAAHEITGEMA